MLTSLSIKNYALIDKLQVDFDKGLTIITGETGAGKSILLGGLSLILGKRADLGSLKSKDEKCVIEADFFIEKYKLQAFFKEADIDYEANTIIRREILPSGKSRAFINDTPVTLDVLASLGSQLIDIHSQHQTLRLTENDFQFRIIDAVAANDSALEEYSLKLKDYHAAKKELQRLIDFQAEANKEHDYNSFLLKELQEAKLENGMLKELEADFEKLNNVEEIGEKLAHAYQQLTAEQYGILSGLTELKSSIQKLASYGEQFDNLYQRVNSVAIELDDIQMEVKRQEESLETDPRLLEEIQSRLQLIYDLQKKHHAIELEELLEIQQALEQKVEVTENLDAEIKQWQLKVLDLEKELDTLAEGIHSNREMAIPRLSSYLEESLFELGMPNAKFDIGVNKTHSYFANGKDELRFLFSANKGSNYGELKKVASGGELSRIMLSIKSILAEYMQLPTIMFDEIDTGVSGEISNKMGDIMAGMSKNMQVFTITHLPQIAAKGESHFEVFKEDVNEVTYTRMKKLDKEERIKAIAEMLGGKDISSSALAHAKQLLN
ncbi:DNA repair protein RecN [Leptobacterium flavescens]|uniref:DNA repair protein RecN n=1 Tax=Leptobacterium flavescens TaxID=472055 RepID=A0A6P0UN87_9FLAO|nr:DNA repair protein RecN [Leptobacterium flavescens]NER13309.1 DNA repair protein RecN [Leptobacterium flavescens]